MARFNLYSSNDQKEHADDALCILMDRRGFKQSYGLEFVRLALGYAGVALAGGVYYIEKKTGFRNNFTLISIACVLYFICQAAVIICQRLLEHNAMYIGSYQSEAPVYIKTGSPSKKPGSYKISVYSSGVERSRELQYQSFVDYNGKVVAERLDKALTDLLPRKK